MLTRLRQGRSFWAQGILILALLAAGIQASLPRGYMLDRDAGSGIVSVVFCTGHGSEQRWLDLTTGEIRDSDTLPQNDRTQDQTCAFASASAALGQLPQAPAFLTPELSRTSGVAQTDTLAPTGHRRPGPHVRAPPARL
tara:strand:- start:166 stop:582 length:417 start_codon:yes stop_codon:yes gene_type:complete